MATPTSFPPNWPALLDQIDQTLSQALHLAESRETLHFQEADSKPTPILEPDILVRHLDDLSKRVEEMEKPLLELDQTLLLEEEHVRKHQTLVKDLSHRLAEWAGQTIK